MINVQVIIRSHVNVNEGIFRISTVRNVLVSDELVSTYARKKGKRKRRARNEAIVRERTLSSSDYRSKYGKRRLFERKRDSPFDTSSL